MDMNEGIKKALELKKQLDDGDISQSAYERELAKLNREADSGNNSNTRSNDRRPSSSSTGIASLVSKALEAGRSQSAAPEDIQYLDRLFQNIGKSESGAVLSIADGLVKTAMEGAEDYIKEQSYLLTTVNRELGLAGQLSKDFREAITEAQPDLVRMGIPFKDLTASVERLVNDTGRFALVGTDMLTKAGQIAQAYGMNMEEIIGAYDDFEKVGIGAAQAQESISEAGKRSLDLGIQSRKVIEGMVDNIGKLNQFGFKNGAEGLEKMVRRSIEVRMNLDDVFSVANKVFDPEGALELSANLQVLGAAFGDFNDPIRLMYMATNEVEGLASALEGVSQNLATYNVETGGFEVTGANLRQARDIANALGMELEDVTRTAIALQERGQVDMALSGLQISEEDKEFLANISRMKDGEMQIELMTPKLQEAFGGASVQLDKLSQEGVNQLLEYRKDFQKLSEGDLVRQQVTLTENLARDVNYLATLGRLRAAGVGDELLKQFAGMSFKDMGTEYSKLLEMDVDKLAKEFGDSSSKVVSQIQESLGLKDYMAEKKKENEKLTTSDKPSETTQNVNISIKSDQLVGRFNKEWSLNPEQWIGGNGYLSPN